ncbi:caveolin-3-like [Mytilus trossulus]|uniref:caveolin-3-like n=1 Tax=Mytilus trossulus TaxID=6551 RepID=UPI003004831E
MSEQQASTSEEVDLVNRDPNSINAHLGSLWFNDVIAEPDGIHSIDCVWKLSSKCFELWKKLCYIIMTTCCGMCIAAEWGCEFAYIAFYHIWFITPCMKVLEINCGVCQKIYALCINCCMYPLCEACGAIFNAFKK